MVCGCAGSMMMVWVVVPVVAGCTVTFCCSFDSSVPALWAICRRRWTEARTSFCWASTALPRSWVHSSLSLIMVSVCGKATRDCTLHVQPFVLPHASDRRVALDVGIGLDPAPAALNHFQRIGTRPSAPGTSTLSGYSAIGASNWSSLLPWKARQPAPVPPHPPAPGPWTGSGTAIASGSAASSHLSNVFLMVVLPFRLSTLTGDGSSGGILSAGSSGTGKPGNCTPVEPARPGMRTDVARRGPRRGLGEAFGPARPILCVQLLQRVHAAVARHQGNRIKLKQTRGGSRGRNQRKQQGYDGCGCRPYATCRGETS